MSEPVYRNAPVRIISSPAIDSAVIEGRARGYSEGLAMARKQAQRDKEKRDTEHKEALANMQSTLQNAMISLARAATSLSTQKVKSLDDVENELFTHATRIAELVVSDELSDASVAARSAIRRALNADTPQPIHTIRLNPEAARAAKQFDMEPEGVKIVSDPTLEPGGAIAEYEDGWLLAGLEDAVRRIKQIADEMLGASEK